MIEEIDFKEFCKAALRAAKETVAKGQEASPEVLTATYVAMLLQELNRVIRSVNNHRHRTGIKRAPGGLIVTSLPFPPEHLKEINAILPEEDRTR